MIIADILLILLYFFTPVVIILLCQKVKFFNRIGSVVIAYIIGLVIGNINILPENAHEIQEIITTITIPLAIPLLLFSANIRSWFKIAGKTMLSMVLELVAIVIIISSGYFIFRENGTQDLHKISGMLIGTYSGGTPNLASLKMMLGVDASTYIKTHTFDLLFSTLYLAFLITIGHRVFSLVLPKFNKKIFKKLNNGLSESDNYSGIFKRDKFLPLLIALIVSALIFGIFGWISLQLDKSYQMIVVILGITTFGVIASLIPAINKIDKTFELGMYFILVFCLDVASMADINNFIGSTPKLFYYVGYAIFGSMLLHLLLSRIFKIDTDTFMITSTALVCSPPFVPMVASAIKNKDIIVSGLTVGIIGYAIGNYLGYFIATILGMF